MNYMKRKSDELYARAMKHGNSEATVIEHMSSLIAYCEGIPNIGVTMQECGPSSATMMSLMPKILPNARNVRRQNNGIP